MKRACPVCMGSHVIGTQCPVFTDRAASMQRIAPKQSNWPNAHRPMTALRHALKDHLMKEYGYCSVCRSTDMLELDHIIPIADGGEDSFDNVQLLCFKHHASKTKADAKARRDSCLLYTSPSPRD